MAQILVRDLDEDVVARLKARARGQGRSLQAEVRTILEEAAKLDSSGARALVRRIRRRFQGRAFVDSADLIREDRER
jgi:plasmid stability protein